MESAPVKRQPRMIWMLAPVTAMEPSQFVAALSPMPRITRNDWAGGTVIGAAGAANWACNSRLPLTASSATNASRTNNNNRGRISQHQPVSASVFVAGQRLSQLALRFIDGFERL